MNTSLPKPPQNKLSFGKALLLMMAVCTTYALLIPESVLTNNPGLATLVGYVESIFPAIAGFAKLSLIPEVVRLYYASMWMGFPFLLIWFGRTVRLQERDVPAYSNRARALLAVLVLSSAAVLLFYLMTQHVPRGVGLNRLFTGGRANALIIGLTNNWVSIGIVSALMFSTLCILTIAIKIAFIYLIKGNKND